MRQGLVLAFCIAIGLAISFGQMAFEPKMPDPKVYRLSRTANGELLVTCTNGADATIRVPDTFGTMIVSCGQ